MAQAKKAELPPRQYEVVYILRPTTEKQPAERVAQRVAEVIARQGGTLTLVENWGRRPMSYEIQHHKRGIYVYLTYLGDGELVAELERNLRLIDEVMRFQTVKISDDPGEVQVDAERIKFEGEEPPAPGTEEEISFEQELGLVGGGRPMRDHRGDDGMDDDLDGDAVGDEGDDE